jgi:hypothetical protein
MKAENKSAYLQLKEFVDRDMWHVPPTEEALRLLLKLVEAAEWRMRSRTLADMQAADMALWAAVRKVTEEQP